MLYSFSLCHVCVLLPALWGFNEKYPLTHRDWVQEKIIDDVEKTEIQTKKLETLNPAKLQIHYDTSSEIKEILIGKNNKLSLAMFQLGMGKIHTVVYIMVTPKSSKSERKLFPILKRW